MIFGAIDFAEGAAPDLVHVVELGERDFKQVGVDLRRSGGSVHTIHSIHNPVFEMDAGGGGGGGARHLVLLPAEKPLATPAAASAALSCRSADGSQVHRGNSVAHGIGWVSHFVGNATRMARAKRRRSQ